MYVGVPGLQGTDINYAMIIPIPKEDGAESLKNLDPSVSLIAILRSLSRL
jgi:hypothetical protein